jgi:hypothetical protein
MSHNPYIVEGQPPTLQNSVFVYMDILGFIDTSLESKENGTLQSTLLHLHETLSKNRGDLEEISIPGETREKDEKDRFALKSFTDNIVIGWPIRTDGETEFGAVFSHIANYQLDMTMRGYFVRGAISIGEIYVDDLTVYGDALIDAYEGENKLARDPRIILTDTAKNLAKKHLLKYSPQDYAPHVRDVLCDADGQWFLNYLDSILIAEYEHGPFFDAFNCHKLEVEKKLEKYVSKPAIWSKYAWVAGYHNYFCDLHPEYFTDDEYRINVNLFKSVPSLIIEAR